jgi:hypothetical protein
VADQVLIVVNDKTTANILQQQLNSQGVTVNRLNTTQAVKFGINLSVSKGQGSLQISPEEILQLIQMTPDALDALSETFIRFREHIKVFVNGKPKVIQPKGPLTRKPSFEDFIRGR